MLLLRFTTFFCCLLLSLKPALSTDPAKVTGSVRQLHCWCIHQQSQLFGECTIYACSEALKVVFKSGKWSNIARAPAWELFVLNPSQKIYCHTPLDKWKANEFHLNLVNSGKTELVRTKQVQKIGGLWAVAMVGKSAGKQEMNATYWVARDIHLPDQIYHVLCGNAFVPQLHALPLKVSMHTAMLQDSVNTTSASQVDLPFTFFDLPKNYKLAAHPEDVMNTGVMDVVKDMTDF
jgi:hypothetical protein